MDNLKSTIDRSMWFAQRIQMRTDERLRATIEGFGEHLNFEPIEDNLISPDAWQHVLTSQIAPRFVFAHPTLLAEHPETSAYYRNMALLPQKRVTDLAYNVKSWEDGSRTAAVPSDVALEVAKLYNAVISSIVEGSTEWTLHDGYRNIIASMGVGFDGTMRNLIGRDADMQVKSRILRWLRSNRLAGTGDPRTAGLNLPRGIAMRYGAEPDIAFFRDGVTVATIEIKGGRDPAGALERLGAARKSFEATPPGCTNFLIAGVVTKEMRRRLDVMGNVKTFLLDDVTSDGREWFSFLDEVFHHTVRIVDSEIKGR